MAYNYRVEVREGIVRASIEGSGSAGDFVAAVRSLGAESVKWPSPLLLVDLRGVETEYSFAEQLMIGRAVGVNFHHMQRHAAIVRPERITRVGERTAQQEGAAVRVFPSEAEALEWLRSPG